MSCQHLAEPGAAEPKTTGECPDCVTVGNADWVHLRGCLTCGHVGCCDSSPLQHATKHFESTGHPVMRSIEPGEAWRWCFVDEEIG
ncbi:UBP-type zinc finger domain-containing protein [Micromonospora sp. 4G57]|uniref:UBP-type zinc finger domain-containing protein n=1 Tax=Micromonospora sicca TaxID=2202420 RepID=A0ABU5JLR3_9ACTN|nr:MULTISPECIES: UBP-type zinc finger domain-containing protein [unclassified Micromonospora]MDZ5446579.1 UBP-type zinc finger domain-containing protein [Micromonospora sp. 4G57]MDZ5493309.1 UBP-type zinc finger domain-containing protein [Micromonospora sp. 4G53]